MSLNAVERVLLERRLARRRRGSSAVAGLAGMIVAAIVLAPTVPALAGIAGAGIAYAALADELDQGLDKIESLHERALTQTTHIYDRNGTLLREMFTGGRRTYRPIDEIPRYVREATIAVEDKTFYDNPGVDVVGISRAVVGELSGNTEMGGGSTLTQQFVRNAVFTYEERTRRSYARKAKEIVLALMLTRQESKDQILEWYLNETYYGNLAYGIEAAADTIFGKSAHELDLAESSLLAGLPQAPADLDPLNPDPAVQRRVRNRQQVVLNLMVDNGFITKAQADRAAAAELAYRQPDKEERFLAPHFTVFIEKELERRLGAERLALGGLEVTTTLDLGLQSLGEATVVEQVEKVRERHNLTSAALVALEPRTGQVLAMVGSADYWNDEIEGRNNLVLSPNEQPGSSFKPITYVTALEQGIPSNFVLWDVPMELEWTNRETGLRDQMEPQNYDETFRGPVRLRAALANSYNIPAMKLLDKIAPSEAWLEDHPDDAEKSGVDLSIDTAERMGVRGLDGDYGLSLTLGGGEVSLLDMATAYATLANGGRLVRPNPILRIADSSGATLYTLADDEEALAPQDAVDPRAAYIVTDFLSDNEARTPAFGPSSPLNLGVPAAAKTGTTNDYKDNWTLGYTPYLVTGVWAGNADNEPMQGTSGVTGAAPIWNAFMRNVVTDEDRRSVVAEARALVDEGMPTTFERPEGVVEGRTCRVQSLNRIGATCLEFETELFLSDDADDGVAVVGEAAPTEAMDETGGPSGDGQDGWITVSAAVVPLPGPPPEVVAAAEAEGQELRWPQALLCQAAPDGFGADKTQPVAVLPLPPENVGPRGGPERRLVVEWAAENGWSALEPTGTCTPEMVAAALEHGTLPGYAEGVLDPETLALVTGNEYRLNLSPGAVLTARTTLTGTVRYNPSSVEYFKVELGRGTEPTEWITLGDVHRDMVLDGPIEVLDALSLPVDDYIVRLVLVKTDGNFLNPPFSVPIRIER